jgi:hypothetical protein
MLTFTEKIALLAVALVFIVLGAIFMVTPFIAGFPLVLVGLYLLKKVFGVTPTTPRKPTTTSPAKMPGQSPNPNDKGNPR